MRSGILRILAVVVGILAISWLIQQGLRLDIEQVREWLVSLGPVAPLAYVLLYTLQVAIAPIPGLPLGAAAGLGFGLVPALVYGTIGLTIGVVLAMLAGRTWGLRVLGRLAGPTAIARWEQMRLVNSPWTWLLVFLGPTPDLILFVAGMSRIPLRVLVPVGVLGRAPAMVCATVFGASVMETGPWLLVVAAAIGLAGTGAGLFLKRFIPPAPAAVAEA